ncbi:dihydroorotate dehydrogenase [Limosilactobacillus vaginalis]|jgi:dihydroorotate dehydrogenase (fumarate)|uniref:dihydroorotate dehydrogenase n=1 Tax=Limosilactobacillus TaxID=2742598 RepID=UPI000BEF09B5|nr:MULTISPECIES: dihydroorotate dehydrogenase [Limosilactobacillus]PEH04072.1 dihydroorotate dehydrogenase B catalytic subunit [Lactobacillus sp. UMNPBX5]MCI6853656.1 dihydroorotate dehydrogenase [Limosilactobacillus vaginalis]MDM8221111.1 dihydroorotate dehydrogenase [Limosilactobacillus vaginalis]MDM8244196.1 dihydroorotate dehydrogenase [Limosilactobacillus vaginalis]MDM8261591.1 dihydroorotate dehydrogenase [Limosilactobacillus vaginalis]
MTDVRLAVNLPGLKMKNPVMPASGTFGFGDVPQARKYDLNRLGAIVIKTTTPQARTGNPQPQIAVLNDGVLNSVGLTNPGVNVVAGEKIPHLKHQYPDLPLVASIGGASVEDYVMVTERLAATGLVDALELNISCPNVKHGGMAFGTDPQVAEKLTKAVKAASGDVPVYVKLTPNVTDIVEIAQAVEAGGADGLSMINTLLGMKINLKTRKPVLGNIMGGLSGTAIKPLAIRMIYQVSHAVNIPIIGEGGISSAEDVIEFFLAGASAVQVGSAHFHDALAMPHIIEQLPQAMARVGIGSLAELRM